MSDVYRGGARRFFLAQIHWVNDKIMAQLVNLNPTIYEPNFVTNTFLSDIPAGAKVGDPVVLPAAGKAVVQGAIDAYDLTFPAVPATTKLVHGVLLYKEVSSGGTVDQASSPLILLFDGKIPVTVAMAASSGDTSLRVDPLLGPLPAGRVLDFGGGVTATLSAPALGGARQVSVNALGSNVAANATANPYVENAGFPWTPDGTDFVFMFDDGPNRILRI